LFLIIFDIKDIFSLSHLSSKELPFFVVIDFDALLSSSERVADIELFKGKSFKTAAKPTNSFLLLPSFVFVLRIRASFLIFFNLFASFGKRSLSFYPRLLPTLILLIFSQYALLAN